MGAHVLERPRTEVDPGKTDFFFFFNARKLLIGKKTGCVSFPAHYSSIWSTVAWDLSSRDWREIVSISIVYIRSSRYIYTDVSLFI